MKDIIHFVVWNDLTNQLMTACGKTCDLADRITLVFKFVTCPDCNPNSEIATTALNIPPQILPALAA